MGIKIIIVVAVICSLISVSSATRGNATYAEKFPSSKCPGDHKDMGKFVAAVNPQFFSMRGYTCGAGVRVMCGNNGDKPYCKHAKFVDVKIVHECSPNECPGENDMVLSKDAFADIAKIEEKKIQVLWMEKSLFGK